MTQSQTHHSLFSATPNTTTMTTFAETMARLHMLWEQSENEMINTQTNLQEMQKSLQEVQQTNASLTCDNQILQSQIAEMTNEITKLNTTIKDSEDYQKQFTKVSHIITMERENTHLKQQIAIMERRVAFYQNQCNDLKVLSTKGPESNEQAVQTEEVYEQTPITHELEPEQLEAKENEQDEVHEDDDGVNVVEKKIKGVIYYVSDEGDIYDKDEDETIGQLRGKIETLPSGKTKVKWYK